MADITITIEDFSPDILDALDNAIIRALMVIGEKCAEHAEDKCPKDTPYLSTQINSKVNEAEYYVEIGTAVEYAKYVEFGTGIYSEKGGRQTPWVYKDKNGEFHLTHGAHPQPFLRPALSEHKDEYIRYLIDSLENA